MFEEAIDFRNMVVILLRKLGPVTITHKDIMSVDPKSMRLRLDYDEVTHEQTIRVEEQPDV